MRIIQIVFTVFITGMLVAGCGSKETEPVNHEAEVEAAVARHMVGEALLTAHFVAAAERCGMSRDEINAVLKDIASKSAIDEFWITDSLGHAYLNNVGVDFTFSPNPAVEPQASAFWPLIDGTESVVIQQAQVREIDDRRFKYVGVSGIDKPRIVQVGISAKDIVAPK